jgi:hypothetical protein
MTRPTAPRRVLREKPAAERAPLVVLDEAAAAAPAPVPEGVDPVPVADVVPDRVLVALTAAEMGTAMCS